MLNKIKTKKIKKIIKNSGMFDIKYYLFNYPDVRLSDIDPIYHYIQYGAEEGRNPSDLFDTKYYLNENHDVKMNGINPLLHYILYGRKEGRQCKGTHEPLLVEHSKVVMNDSVSKNIFPLKEGSSDLKHCVKDMNGNQILLFPRPVYEGSNYELNIEVDGPFLKIPYESSIKVNPIDLGVHLHLFYLEQKNEFSYFLKNIEFPFYLYISIVDHDHKINLKEYFKRQLPYAKVVIKVVENHGRDIAPFICAFNVDMKQHDYILHLHSKQSLHNPNKADWRRQLLVNLIGSKTIVNTVTKILADNEHIGMLFPTYHFSLQGQISWGTNFKRAKQLSNRFGFEIDEKELTIFPAGSMFWARRKAIEQLFDKMTYTDFEKEDGQVDGTTAHAVERLFGEITRKNGFDLFQIRSDRQHNLIKYFPKKWKYEEDAGIEDVILRYNEEKYSNNKIVVYTAVAGGYDQPVRHKKLDSRIDYIFFTDQAVDNQGFWEVRPIDYYHTDAVRMARRIRTNPHSYLSGYDIAIWIDANVIIEGDLYPYIEKVKQSGLPLGCIPHPERNCIYKEAEMVLKNRDKSGRVERQIEEYKSKKFPYNIGLIETNFMIINLKHTAVKNIMSSWWSEIVKFSHRDQLSLDYVLWKEKQSYCELMREKQSLRDHFDFAYLGHGENSGYKKYQLQKVATNVLDPFKWHGQLKKVDCKRPAIDIVVCVHNALEEVNVCLSSLLTSRREKDRIIIVDDASEYETKKYLEQFSQNNKHVVLCRNDGEARGYSKSANIGMSMVENEYYLLLNSDTEITSSAIDSMLKVMMENEQIGIVGPLSNAASTQSIPNIKSTATQTAVNVIPDDHTVEMMNKLCMEWSEEFVPPVVPLVHGFCQLIRTDVYRSIGGFDELLFPQGYGEENDFCLRAGDVGYDLKIAVNAFVYHEKSASYTDDEKRSRLMKEGSIKLKERYGEDRMRQSVMIMEQHPLLVRMRQKASKYFLDYKVRK